MDQEWSRHSRTVVSSRLSHLCGFSFSAKTTLNGGPTLEISLLRSGKK